MPLSSALFSACLEADACSPGVSISSSCTPCTMPRTTRTRLVDSPNADVLAAGRSNRELMSSDFPVPARKGPRDVGEGPVKGMV